MRALLRSRKVRSRLKRHALNHNLIRRPLAPRCRRRGHDHFRVLDPIDHFAKDRILLIERRLFLERDKPLTVRAVNIARAGRAQSSPLVRNVAELRRNIWIGRIARAPGGCVTALRQRIAALDDSQIRINPMNRGAIKKLFIDELLKPLDVLRRNVRIELDHNAPVISGFDYCNFGIGLRLCTGFDFRARSVRIGVFGRRV